MPGLQTTARTIVSPAEVWPLVADPLAWADWGAWSAIEADDHGPMAPGTERTLVTGPWRVRERVLSSVPQRHLSYELVEGMKVDGYRSLITLDETSYGTAITWRSQWEHAGPVTSALLRIAVRRACRDLARAATANARPRRMETVASRGLALPRRAGRVGLRLRG